VLVAARGARCPAKPLGEPRGGEDEGHEHRQAEQRVAERERPRIGLEEQRVVQEVGHELGKRLDAAEAIDIDGGHGSVQLHPGSQAALFEKCHEPRLFKVVVRGERVGDVPLLHYRERNAIGQGPMLVGPRVVEDNRPSE